MKFRQACPFTGTNVRRAGVGLQMATFAVVLDCDQTKLEDYAVKMTNKIVARRRREYYFRMALPQKFGLS